MRKTYLIDLDGTMYKGTDIIDGAKEFIDYLKKTNQKFVFFTNNSSRTPQQALAHMEQLGFIGLNEDNFFTSAMAAAKHISKYYQGNNAYYIGMEGLKVALLNEGFNLVNSGADFVFVGLDKTGTYEKYSIALQNLVAGAKLVGTNNDRILLQENGANVGNGSIVAMLEHAANQTSIKIGKPYRVMVDEFLAHYHLDKAECVIIGDNLETDIKCGNDVGIETILVESGVHQESDCEVYHIYPSKIIKSLYEIIEED